MNLIEDDAKIWRYMDVAKFASLLTTRCLYFACPTQFRDPYEGWLPKSHIEVWSSMLQKYVDDWRALRPHFPTESVSQFDSGLATIADRMSTVLPETVAKFGVSCWHENEGESDAMWKLYSPTGQTVAIESTVRQLESALMNQKGIVIDRVRYEDFDNARIEKGHKSYVLHIKRKCFEHEREIRATVPLPKPGVGILVPCDLDVLVTCIHISPLAEDYVRDAIAALCSAGNQPLEKCVLKSSLYRMPDYNIKLTTE